MRPEADVATTLSDVLSFRREAGTRFQLLLLVGDTLPVVKPGVQALSLAVLSRMIDVNGPLDQMLRHLAADRPSTVRYARWSLDERDPEVMAAVGVVWLPQVRLVRGDNTIFRSGVALADNGSFIASDVGGQSYRRKAGVPLLPLADLINNEIDRLSKKRT